MFTNETDRMLADGGVMQEGGTVDPVSGNDVPPGAMQEEVRDDIDAKLSEGEFVIPADVVRYIGLSTLMKMRDKAKAGLKKMEDIGQMGNAEEVPNAEALHGGESEEMDEESFGAEVDSILGEEEEGMPAFAEGGYVDPANAAIYKDAPIKGFEMVRMVNAAGNIIYIPHTKGKPMLTVPAGYVPSLSTLRPVIETPTTPSPSTGAAGAGGAGGSDSGGGGGGGPAGGGAGGAGGGGAGGDSIFGGSYGVSFDEQGNVVAGKSGISGGKAMFGGMLGTMLTGIPGLSFAAMAANKAYNKAAEAEAAGLRASIADTMGVNANMNTLAATAGISGTGGVAAAAAQAAAAEAVASGYSDRAVGAAAQAAANAVMNGASPAEAIEAGAQAAAAANNVEAGRAVAAENEAIAQAAVNAQAAAADAAAQAAAQAAAEAAAQTSTIANDIDAVDASTGMGIGVAGSNDTTAAADNSGNTRGETSSESGVGNPGESSANDSGVGPAGADNGGFGYMAKGGFVSKKNKPVATKSKKGLASRK